MASRCHCNSCSRETDHELIGKSVTSVANPDASTIDTRSEILKCKGCGECVIREEKVYFDWTPDENEGETQFGDIVYKPPRLWRRAPSWLDDVDPDLKGLLSEVYSATNDQQVRLLSMGVRAVLDLMMNRILGEDVGGFERKLDEMVMRGHLTANQKENLATVIDAGSASTHRSFRPPKELLDEMVSTMEALVREHYISGPMLATAKTLIPPRPPRRRQPS